jgi:hypothetical protein
MSHESEKQNQWVISSRRRVGNVVKGFARNGDDVLGNCKVVHALNREWKLLLRPAEHHLSNLTQLVIHMFCVGLPFTLVVRRYANGKS